MQKFVWTTKVGFSLDYTLRDSKGIALEWGSARREKDFWRNGRAPEEAAMDSASRCSIEALWSVEVEAPIVVAGIIVR